jgi:teichuronic acid biosynthesis glycosyltransferase TuaG
MYVEKLVSIVTPAYNASHFIGAAIESVRCQTYQNWEMLIVDDLSKDETVIVVDSYAKLDSRIRLIRLNANVGPAMARQAGLDAACGRYLAFLDSDDLWLPQKLERQLSFMRTYDAALSFTRFRRISEAGDICGRLISVPIRLNYRQLLKNTIIATSTVLIDRVKTGPFRMTRTYYDDYALWLELLKRGFTAYGLQQDLMRYRVVGKSVSRNKVKSAIEVWRTYRDVEKLYLPHATWYFLNYAWRAYFKYRTF